MIPDGMSIDRDGIYRAEFPGDEAVIGWFLEQDLQSNQEVCREYISSLETVQKGEAPTWQATGNAFTVTAIGNECTIECEFSDDVLRVSTERLVEFLKAWANHITGQT